MFIGPIVSIGFIIACVALVLSIIVFVRPSATPNTTPSLTSVPNMLFALTDRISPTLHYTNNIDAEIVNGNDTAGLIKISSNRDHNIGDVFTITLVFGSPLSNVSSVIITPLVNSTFPNSLMNNAVVSEVSCVSFKISGVFKTTLDHSAAYYYTVT